MEKLLIARLPECSWFGDYQILLDLESTFEMEAGKLSKQDRENGANFIQIYKLKANVLIDLSGKYPQFRRFLLLRAT